MDDISILIVEDDIDLSGIIHDYLASEGYHIKQAYNGNDAIKMAKEISPTLIILDIMLPKVDGIEVCRNIRTYSHCPIIIISAKSLESDKLLSLAMGADDYLIKPFSFPELVGRVKSHLRRYTLFQSKASTNLDAKRKLGRLTIDSSSHIVCVDEKEISLTSKEFNLLDFFSSHPLQVFTKQQLMDNLWGYNEFIDDNTIAVYVGRLREKLAKENITCIKTVWGVGYRWEMEDKNHISK